MADVKPPYAAFGRALRDAMQSTGYTGVSLAAKTGYTRSGISRCRLGFRLPGPDRLAEMAEVLSAPHLVTIARRSRKQECDECHRAFQSRPGTPMRFCGDACRRRWHRTREREARADAVEEKVKSYARRVTELEKRIEIITVERNDILADVAAFCWECEPEGLCRMAACRMRDRSPLPLADERLLIA